MEQAVDELRRQLVEREESDAWERAAGDTEFRAEARDLETAYGIVDRDLLYAQDMAAMGQPLTPHLAAKLTRVGG